MSPLCESFLPADKLDAMEPFYPLHVLVCSKCFLVQINEYVRPDEIFHCAGLPHVAESWRDTAAPLAANVLGTHRLIEAVERGATRCRSLVTGSAPLS